MTTDPKLPPELSGDWPEPVMSGADKAAEAKVRSETARAARGFCTKCGSPGVPSGRTICDGCVKATATRSVVRAAIGGRYKLPGTDAEVFIPAAPVPGSTINIARGRKCAMPDCENVVVDRLRQFCSRCKP